MVKADTWGALGILAGVATVVLGMGWLMVTHSNAYWLVLPILVAAGSLVGAGLHFLRHAEAEPQEDPYARKMWWAGLAGGALLSGLSMGYLVYDHVGPVEGPGVGLTWWAREEFRTIGNASYEAETAAAPDPVALGLREAQPGPVQTAPKHTERVWVQVDWSAQGSLDVVVERKDGRDFHVQVEPGKPVSLGSGNWSGMEWAMRVQDSGFPTEPTHYVVQVTYEARWVVECTTKTEQAGFGEDGQGAYVDGNNPGPCMGEVTERIVS